MKALADALQPVTASCDERGHPIDLFRALEPAVPARRRRGLGGARAPGAHPQALHAGRGQRVRRRDPRRLRQGVRRQLLRTPTARRSWRTTCRRTSAPEFKGEYLDRYVPVDAAARRCRSFTRSARAIRSRRPTSRRRSNDGLPETLEEWIPLNGLTHFKIKLNGDNLDWDVDRIVRIDRIVNRRAQARPRRRRLELLARLQRELPERRLPARVPAAGARGDAERLRAHPVHRAADGPRPAKGSLATSCTRRRSCGRWSSTSR